MSTETTNKKIKIDNGTTFGRTYTDKAVDELLKNVDSVFDITPYLTSQTSISVEGYNALREFIVTNKGSISKVLIGSDYFYYTLCQLNENGMLFTKVGGESHESSDTVVISLMITSDGSCTFINNTYTPVKANPSNPISILRTIGIGGSVYSIPTGVERTLTIPIANILTDATKIQTIFNAMSSDPTSRTHTAISLDNFIPLSEFQNCDKIILDLSSLSSLGVSGQLVFTKGFNTGSHGRAFYLTYMVGTVTSFSITNVVLATGSDGTALTRLVVEQSGTATPLIDTDLANYYTKTEVDSTIQSTIGDINSILDNINGEVI